MNEIIKKALDSINIQNFYITRGNNETKDIYVVFSHIDSPDCYGDNKKQGIMYSILVNLYCKRSIESSKKLIINTLNDAGLKGGQCQPPVVDERGYYNTAINFKYFLREE